MKDWKKKKKEEKRHGGGGMQGRGVDGICCWSFVRTTNA